MIAAMGLTVDQAYLRGMLQRDLRERSSKRMRSIKEQEKEVVDIEEREDGEREKDEDRLAVIVMEDTFCLKPNPFTFPHSGRDEELINC